MLLFNAAVFLALRLSVGHAQENAVDLSVLDGLSDTEIATKFASNPELLRKFLRAANVNVGGIRRSSSSRLSGSAQSPNQETTLPLSTSSEELLNSTSCAAVEESLGSSPPGLEYLGIGYNFVIGNPRGSLSSELDPGFGFPVLNLSHQTIATTRGYYLKGSKACTYSKESKDISSSRDYQENLSKESTSDTSISAGFSVLGASFSASTAFSRSEKMAEFNQEKETMNTVSFETMAKCTEVSAEINPYKTLALDETFKAALSSLPDSYDGNNETSKMLYHKFLNTYGTHYITQLDMGGKMVVTNEISSSDVMSLTRNNIDIAKSMSFEMSFEYGESGSDPAKTQKEQKFEMKKPVCCGENFTYPDSKKVDSLFEKPGKKKTPFGVNVGFTHKESSKESKSKTDTNSVSSKIAKSSTFTIGGLPPKGGAWQTWAASVKANPMPVSYKYAPLWTLPQFQAKANAFFEAVKHIYNIDIEPYKQKAAGLRYGVAHASGRAISRYSLDPDSTRRAYLQLALLPSSEVATNTIAVYRKDDLQGSTAWTGFIGATQEGFYACGLRAKYSHKRAIDRNGGGISGLDVRYCSKEDWFDQEQKIVYRSVYGVVNKWKMCDAKQFIVQIQPAVEINDHVNALDIETLSIKCANLEGEVWDTYADGGLIDIVDSKYGERTPVMPTKLIPGNLIKSFRVQYGGYRDLIRGIEMKITSSETISGPPTPVYYYETFWNVKASQVSAVFATPIRGKPMESAHESKQLSFTTSQGLLNVESSSHYTYIEDPERPKLAITDFKSDIEEEDLPSFSFLVTKTGFLDDSESMVAGVVNPDGYGVGYQNVQFRVVAEEEDNPNLVTLIPNIPMNNTYVQLLTAPMWLPSSNSRFPANAGDVATASGPCVKDDKQWKCRVHVGVEESDAARKHLGFSFLAIGSNVSSDVALSGSVEMRDGYKVDSDSSTLSPGVTAHESFTDSPGGNFSFYAGEGDVAKFNIKNQRTGGVLLKFDPAFKDIPSVIVSPRLPKESTLSRHSLDVVQMPHVVVEHVTKSEALVRAGLLNTLSAGLSAVVEACTSSLNLRQTFIPKFNQAGWIKIGGLCLEEAEGYVDAVGCDPKKSSQKWVFDGQRIRKANDPSICIWGRGHNGRIALHTCGSDVNALDDERFKFHTSDGGYTSLDTQYDRCLYREGNEIKLSTQNDSRCWDGSAPDWNEIKTVEGLPTAGFKLSSNIDDTDSITFNKCFSGYTDGKVGKVDPLGSCAFGGWLVSLSSSDPNDTSFKLKLVSGDEVNDLWLARDGVGFYLKEGFADASEFDIDPMFFSQADRSIDYIAHRIKMHGDTGNCVAWTRHITDQAEFDVEGTVFEPIGFNFVALAPEREEVHNATQRSTESIMAWSQEG